MNPIVRVEELRKTYGTTTAVDNISFEVLEGEIFGIVGPNGAGKTTTIECLEGIRKPDSGRIQILGKNPEKDLKLLEIAHRHAVTAIQSSGPNEGLGSSGFIQHFLSQSGKLAGPPANIGT